MSIPEAIVIASRAISAAGRAVCSSLLRRPSFDRLRAPLPAPHREEYSVVQETFPTNMEEATRLLDGAFAKIFTLGQESVDILRGVSRQIEATQSSSTG